MSCREKLGKFSTVSPALGTFEFLINCQWWTFKLNVSIASRFNQSGCTNVHFSISKFQSSSSETFNSKPSIRNLANELRWIRWTAIAHNDPDFNPVAHDPTAHNPTVHKLLITQTDPHTDTDLRISKNNTRTIPLVDQRTFTSASEQSLRVARLGRIVQYESCSTFQDVCRFYLPNSSKKQPASTVLLGWLDNSARRQGIHAKLLSPRSSRLYYSTGYSTGNSTGNALPPHWHSVVQAVDRCDWSSRFCCRLGSGGVGSDSRF